ncbi:hypothetical protein D5086_011033 [Populus alba]|uniref:Uncharacterized protein n=1 Tax=Populus alba TaxID=43335 RepID=A0ACC4CBD9_POPAL
MLIRNSNPGWLPRFHARISNGYYYLLELGDVLDTCKGNQSAFPRKKGHYGVISECPVDDASQHLGQEIHLGMAIRQAEALDEPSTPSICTCIGSLFSHN